VVSYERTVENHSDQDVIDVFWPVAGYAKDLLPSKRAICDQTTLVGESVTDSGVLNFGASNRPNYNTSSYHPRNGWSSGKLVGLETGKRAGLENDKQPPLSSELEVAVQGANGTAICAVHLISTIEQREQGRTRYNYSMENRGPEELKLFWDAPRTKDSVGEFPMSRDKPLLLGAKDSTSVYLESSQRPVANISTFFIFDSSGKLVGRSIVGTWGQYQGQTTTDFSKEWTRAEK
jgi:hypothetical protein